MNINVIFDDVKIYNVQDRLDVVRGQTFQLEILEELPEDFEIFTNNDPILSMIGMSIEAVSNGNSKIRFMSGSSVIKDLAIWVVDATHPAATSLNGDLGQPVPK